MFVQKIMTHANLLYLHKFCTKEYQNLICPGTMSSRLESGYSSSRLRATERAAYNQRFHDLCSVFTWDLIIWQRPYRRRSALNRPPAKSNSPLRTTDCVLDEVTSKVQRQGFLNLLRKNPKKNPFQKSLFFLIKH